jgi:predicted enzyme related to lactoylglutathione lyase
VQLVPETKTGAKNRVHADILVANLDEALATVVAAGGTRLRTYQDAGSNPVYVCADPDGNEFCLVI